MLRLLGMLTLGHMVFGGHHHRRAHRRHRRLLRRGLLLGALIGLFVGSENARRGDARSRII